MHSKRTGFSSYPVLRSFQTSSCTDWERDLHQIRVCDLATGQQLFYWEIPGGLVSGQPQIQLVGENTLMVTLRRWDTDTQWIYRMEYGEHM